MLSERLLPSFSSKSFAKSNQNRFPMQQWEAAQARKQVLLLEKCLKLQKAYEAHPQKGLARYKYPTMVKTLGNFKLRVVEGEINDSQIIVILGKEGTGKTTFLQMLAETMELEFNVSYKPQNLIFLKKLSKHTVLGLQTVGYLLYSTIHSCMNPEFVHNVMEPLHINLLMDKLVRDLSPGQQQSVALCLCLGKPADIYLLDEPSAHLEPWQRVAGATVIKWFICHEKKAAVVVECDLTIAFELAHKCIVTEGQPFVSCTVNGPVSVNTAAKLFLSQLDNTMQRSPVELNVDRLPIVSSSNRNCTPKQQLDNTKQRSPVELNVDRLPIVNSSNRYCTPKQHQFAAVGTPNPFEQMYFTKQRRVAAETAATPHPYDRVLSLELLKIRLAEVAAEAAAAETHPQKPQSRYGYPSMNKTLGDFRLRVVEGEFTDSQIVVVLSEKGTGKTAFLNMLAGVIKPDEVEIFDVEMPKFNVSYKPQYLFPKNRPILHTVGDLLYHVIHDSCMNPKFVYNVMKPLHINCLMDKVVKDLSPKQAQSVALCICLGQPADIYLIDVPSAYLDEGQFLAAAKVIKWFIHHEKKAAVVVEDGFLKAFELADRYILLEGQPFVDCTANGPVELLAGANPLVSGLDDDTDMVEFFMDLKELEVEHKQQKKLDAVHKQQKAAGSSY